MCMPALQLRRWGLLVALQVLLLQASRGLDVSLGSEAIQQQGEVRSGREGRGLLQDPAQAASQAASAGAGEQVAGQHEEPSVAAAAAAQPSVTGEAAGSSGEVAPQAADAVATASTPALAADTSTAAEQAAGQPAAASSLTPATTPAAAAGENSGSAAASPALPLPASPYTVAVPQQGPEAYIAICAAVKDQHIDVREWIFYHRAVGINKFYLVDTGSKPPMQTVLEDYINSGLVEYSYDTAIPPREGTHGPQVTVYERCLKNHGHRHTWVAFIDVDEFLILRDGTPNMPTLLKDYEQHGGLVVNWVMFGSSGLQKRPATNTLMSYWKCAPEQHPENCHVKSIVRPPHVNDSTTDPHHFKYNKPLGAVNTRYELVKGPKSANATLDRVGLYHYSIKSLEEFQMKMARGSGMGNQKTMAYLEYIDNFTTADCFDAIDVGVQLAGFAQY